MIRTGVDTVSVFGRAAQGVRLMRLAQGSRLISAALTEKEESGEDAEDSQDGGQG